MSARKLTPAKKVAMQRQFNEYMRQFARIQNADRFKDWPIPEPRTIGQEFEDTKGKRMPLEVPAQPVEWRHEGGLMVGTPPKGGAYQFLHDDFVATARNHNGMMALVEGLRALAVNPEIAGGDESGAFIAGLLAEVEGHYTGELLALLPSVGSAVNVSNRKDRKAVGDVKKFAVQLYQQGPFGGGQWPNLPTAARAIEPKVNTRAAELGWPRKKTTYSYQVIQGWIKEYLESTSKNEA